MRRVTRTIAAAGAAIVCCVTMTACSSPFGLPISGSVQTLAPVEQQTQRVYTNPQGPADDAQPETIVKGFYDAMPAGVQQASSTANRLFAMYGSSFAGFPRGACFPAGSIGSIPSAARGTRRGLLSAKRLQKRRTTVKNRDASVFVGEGFIPPGVFAAAASSTLPALRRHLPCKGRQGTLAPSARGLRPQAVGERTVRLPEIFWAMTRFSPSAPSGHLPRRGRFFDSLGAAYMRPGSVRQTGAYGKPAGRACPAPTALRSPDTRTPTARPNPAPHLSRLHTVPNSHQ